MAQRNRGTLPLSTLIPLSLSIYYYMNHSLKVSGDIGLVQRMRREKKISILCTQLTAVRRKSKAVSVSREKKKYWILPSPKIVHYSIVEYLKHDLKPKHAKYKKKKKECFIFKIITWITKKEESSKKKKIIVFNSDSFLQFKHKKKNAVKDKKNTKYTREKERKDTVAGF